MGSQAWLGWEVRHYGARLGKEPAAAYTPEELQIDLCKSNVGILGNR